MLSCLKQRYLGVQMAAQTGILSLQTVVYDWSSAARAIRSLARTSFAYFEDLTPAATRKYLTEVEYKEYLPGEAAIVALASDTLTPELGASMLTEAFSAVAEAVQKTGPQGKRLVRAFSSASNITSAAVEHWQSANMTQSAARVITSIGRVRNLLQKMQMTRSSPSDTTSLCSPRARAGEAQIESCEGRGCAGGAKSQFVRARRCRRFLRLEPVTLSFPLCASIVKS